MKTLKLTKRGCDFRPDSLEYQQSDLENYRLFGYVSKHECIEVDTWNFKKSKYSKFRVVKTHIDNQYEKQEICTMADGTKKKMLDVIQELRKMRNYGRTNKSKCFKVYK